MTKKFTVQITALFALELLGLFANLAHAARIIKFYGSGDNAVDYAQYRQPPVRSTCKITINNQSGESQVYTLSVSADATGLDAGAASPTTTNGTIPPTNITITNGSTHNYTYTYPAITIGTPGTFIGVQHVDCNGSLTITDVGANPGSLGFSGIINTYTEDLQYSHFATGQNIVGSTAIPGFVPLSTGQN